MGPCTEAAGPPGVPGSQLPSWGLAVMGTRVHDCPAAHPATSAPLASSVCVDRSTWVAWAFLPQAAVLWGHFLSRPGPARGRFTLCELRSPHCVAPGGLPSGRGLCILACEVGRVKKLFPEAPGGQGRLVQGGRRGVQTVLGRDDVAGLSAGSREQGRVPRPCPRVDATLGTGGRGRQVRNVEERRPEAEAQGGRGAGG